MTGTERILSARKALERLTPLRADCGRICGAACCSADEDGQGGMLLFPGEEALYSPCPDWARLSESDVFPGQYLLTCNGACLRAMRPLSCRIFPLTPRIREGKLCVEIDVRAWPVCPLMEHGKSGMLPAFVSAVEEAMTLLNEDAACREYFEKLSAHLAQYERF